MLRGTRTTNKKNKNVIFSSGVGL